MHNPFDPYQLWLGIVPADQPPNHYRLLGLRPFENNVEAIRQAAAGRIAQIHSFARGRYADLAERLIAEVNVARDTLTNPARKAPYDQQLHAGSAAPRPVPIVVPRAIPVPTATSPAGATEPAAATFSIAAGSAGRGSLASRASRSGNRRQSHGWLMLGAVVVGLLGVAALLVTRLPQKPRGVGRATSRGPSERRQANTRDKDSSNWPTPVVAPAEEKPDRPEPRSARRTSPSRAPRPRGPETLSDLMQGEEPPADKGTVTGALQAARQAMSQRDLAAAKQHLQSANNAAHATRERDEVLRVQKLLFTLEAFWKAVRERFGHLKALDELKIGDHVIVVVQADKEQLIVRAEGRNYIYTVEDLPGQLAIYLAQRGLAAGQSTRQLCFGAFHAIDRRGNRQEARRCWEQAGAEGQAMMVELETAPPPDAAGGREDSAASATPVSLPSREVMPGGEALPSAPPPSRPKKPLPNAAALAQAAGQVRDQLKGDFERADTPPKKKDLARRLAEMADKSGGDPARQFACLDLARGLAAQGGDPEIINRVIDAVDRDYPIDALRWKAEALATAWRVEESAPYRLAIFRQSQQLLDVALKARNYPAADQLIRVVQAGARAAKDYRLLRELDEQVKEIKASLKNGA
jgi:curved DNA-binding protein CbpA